MNSNGQSIQQAPALLASGILAAPSFQQKARHFMTKLSIIVAIDSQHGIGVKNTLPWHLPQDLAHFKRTTSGHPIIMGRKTFDSIGRALPNRRNIVISRGTACPAPTCYDGVEVVPSIAAALELVGDTEAFIIGGAQIFIEMLPLAERLIVTEIGKNFDCDVFFPFISTQEWIEVAREQHHCEKNDFEYAFVTYQKC